MPSYLLDATDPTLCGRFFINADKNNDYGTKAAFPSWLYPEDGNRFFPGTDQSRWPVTSAATPGRPTPRSR